MDFAYGVFCNDKVTKKMWSTASSRRPFSIFFVLKRCRDVLQRRSAYSSFRPFSLMIVRNVVPSSMLPMKRVRTRIFFP